MAKSASRNVIVTFKRKDKRSDKKKDKTELLMAALERDVQLVNMSAMAPAERLPRSLDPATTGFDINRYEAPIVTLSVTDEELKSLKKSKDVATVEEDAPMHAFTPGGPGLLFEGQPTIEGETVPSGISQIKAPRAWEVTKGKGIKVAILDTGIDDRHPDLAANCRGGQSFVPHETSTMDHNGHGTHCAGTVAASLTGSGVVGVAPNAYLYAVKVLDARGSGSFSWLIAALDWCIDNEIHVASMSLGAPSAPSAVGAMCVAFENGVLVLAAAGNSAGPVSFPAAYGSVVAVSAIDSNNALASFSCRGAEVELAAPGVDVLSAAPGGGHARLSGTSMACPHATGAAALAWSSHRFPSGDLAQNVTIRRLLAHTVDNLGVPGRDELFGFGRVNAEAAAFALIPPPAMPGLP